MSEILLKIEQLSQHFEAEDGSRVQALDAVSLDIFKGETLALVGESGSGKSTFGQSLLQLQRPSAGRVIYGDQDLTTLGDKPMAALRQQLQIVFQDPLSALNPRMTVGAAIADPIRFHRLLPEHQIAARVLGVLNDVGLGGRFINHYPHQLSGGQAQRVAIGRALACRPKFIVCDEATSALDVSVQAQILNLFVDLQVEHGLTYLFISHDLAVVRHFADRVAVIYRGRIVELAPTRELFANPMHPYTRLLLAAAPAFGAAQAAGDLPAHAPASWTAAEPAPALREISPGHFVAPSLADATS